MAKMSDRQRRIIEEAAYQCRGYQQYNRSDVLMLLNHIKAVEWECGAHLEVSKREGAANERLIDCIVKLQRDLEEVKGGRKVALPQEVAEALEYFRNNSTDNQTVLRSIENVRLIGPFATTLRDFSKSNFDRLLAAMINGYTVEQTPEDRIGMKISSMLFAMNIETPIPVDQLAKQLATMLQDEIAESSKTTI